MTSSQNFVASNGESRNPLYEGCFEGETLVAAANRRHWALAAQELALACATHPLAAAVLQQEAGEPVARLRSEGDNGQVVIDQIYRPLHVGTYEVYTTPQVSPPQARVPLTQEQANEVWRAWVSADNAPCDWCSLLRLTERAHLITHKGD